MRQNLSNRILTVAAAGLLVAAIPFPTVAQDDLDPRRVYMTRGELQQLLDRLELTAQSPAYSDALRERTRNEAELIRSRLEQGDFQVGDRIYLTVENEEALTDTFTVDRGRILRFPDIGDLGVGGLLRAELDSALVAFVSRYVRQPRVTARSLLPITITGAVSVPGFYMLPSELRFADALMEAGGYTAAARITEIRVERGEEKIWDEESVQLAITDGRTLDQMSLRPGDYVIVPERGSGLGGAESTFRAIGYLLTIPLSVVALIAIF